MFDAHGRLLTPRISRGVALGEVPGRRMAVAAALRGSRAVDPLPGVVTVVSAPIFRNGRLSGALLARAERPEEIERAIDALRGDRLTAAAIAVAVAVVIGFLIATAITSRVKRLADSAARITEGGLDEPLEGTGGRDEITDLGTALETMRIALRETFGALSSERDRLSAIFDALDDAVMVVGPDGEVRFSNRAAEPLIGPDGKAIEALVPWLRRAAERGTAEHDGLRVGERVYALGIRELPAEDAVLAVVRDRTDGLRRELAEREFVSNAAHELRNPIAGISGAIEVLRAGAKDDPNAREHFLGAPLRGRGAGQPPDRLAADAGADGGGRRGDDGGARRGDRDRGGRPGGRASRRDRGRGRDRSRHRRSGRLGAPAPGPDRPADERVQEHAPARRRYASRASSNGTARY